MTSAFRRAVVLSSWSRAELNCPTRPTAASNSAIDFKAPQAVKAGAEGEIRIQILAGDEHRSLFEEIWKIKGPVKKGAPLLLEFQFNENQVLELRMGMPGVDNTVAHLKI